MRSLLAFFTTVPVRGGSLEEAARWAFLLPLAGLLTGAPGALILLAPVLPPPVSATLALAAALLMAGLHHADGVLDVGDALMVRGDARRRREALKDARTGVGGIGALFIVYAPALAALAALAGAAPARAALALFAAEVAARSAMLLLLAFGRPAEERSSAAPFVRALKGRKGNLGIMLALLAPLPLAVPFGLAGALAALSAPAVALAALWLSGRTFGGIGGDVSGATGEVARTALLVILSATV